jgi:benzoate-CoA ligase family protein
MKSACGLWPRPSPTWESGSLLPLIESLSRERLRYLETVIVVGGKPEAGGLSFDQWAQIHSTTLQPEPTSKDDAALWLYSSGSTGRPKACVHLHHDLLVSSERYAKAILGVTEKDRLFSVAKLFFAYGLGNGMTFPLWVGGTSVLLETRPTPASTFETVAKFRPTLYFGVPTLYAAQLQAMETGGVPDFSSVRSCVSAGEALPADILARWKQKTGVLILDGIGSTEALHIFISNRTEDCKPGSSGRVVQGYEVRIVDGSGAIVAPGTLGRLQIKGASTAAYYWNNPEKTKATMLGEWLDTGDTYYQDTDGYFFYCGRSDDMLKVGGIWCSPFEVESALISHPKILEVAVVGRADDAGLTKPEAWVVLESGCTPSAQLEEELVQHCKQHLASYKSPRWIRFVDSLPKTATGKIQRYKLKQLAR